MARTPRIALFGIAGVLGVLLLLAAALYMLVDTNVAKTRLEAAASQALGMEISMAGRPAIQVFPGLLLTLDDVHVRSRGKEVASAKQVTVGIELRSLFGNNWRIDKLGLTNPVVSLERERDGRLNIEPSTATEPATPDQVWPDVVLTGANIVFVDKRFGKGFEARDCHGEIRRARRSGGPRADFLKLVSFGADIGCAQLRKDGFTLLDLKFTADAKNGVFDLKPVTTRLFGTPGTGTVRADFTGPVAAYQLSYALTQFPIEEFFRTASLEKRAAGRMDFSATLSTRGSSMKELRQAMTGHVSLRGKDITFIGSDLDAAFARFESSQTFSLVDVGAVFFAGPLGLLVTKGYDFAKLARGTGGSSEIRTLVSDWKVDRGVARARDVAMSTKQNRIALQGGLDLVDDRFDDMSVALVDAKGCVIVQQKIRGSFEDPVVEKPNLIKALTGPALRLLRKGSSLVLGEHCEVFYAGSVAAPR